MIPNATKVGIKQKYLDQRGHPYKAHPYKTTHFV